MKKVWIVLRIAGHIKRNSRFTKHGGAHKDAKRFFVAERNAKSLTLEQKKKYRASVVSVNRLGSKYVEGRFMRSYWYVRGAKSGQLPRAILREFPPVCCV